MDVSKITDLEFGQILEEFRRRGYAIACYGVGELGEGPLQDHDGDYNESAIKKWLEENREDVEDTMCEAVWAKYAGLDINEEVK